MKHFYTTIIIVFCSFTTFGQGYHKLINESMYWDHTWAAMGYICGGFSDGPPHRYSFSGDTLINDTLYAKMYSNAFVPYYPPPPTCPPFDVDTIPELCSFYFLREDTIEQKVWRYTPYYDVEDLLYDFSLQQGDTLYNSFPCPTLIDSVYDITTDDGIVRKKFEVAGGWAQEGGYYIEGIGGVAGVFNHPFHYFEAGAWLMCVKDNNANIVLDINGNCYDFMTSAPSIKNNPQIRVFPNPFSKNITIESSFEKLNIEIHDPYGHELIAKELDGKCTVNLSNLCPGIYFLKIIVGNNVVLAKKIVKANGQ